jgi:ribosomal protein S18 acetylase RimI-like enzyme
MRYQRERGLVSWLHVTATNYRAIEVYKALQFKTTAEVILHRVSLSVGQDDGG